MSEETSANNLEVAEQGTQSENNLEVAEQEATNEETNGTTNEETEEEVEPTTERDFDKDHAYAELRRQKEEAEARAEELEKEHQKQELEQNKTSTFAEIEKLGTENGLSEDEIASLKTSVESELNAELQIKALELEKEKLETQNAEFRAEQMVKADIEAIQKIDSTVKSIEDLGNDFLTFRTMADENGEFMLTAEQAYYASKAKANDLDMKKPKAPKDTGSISANLESGEKSYFTRDEVMAMSDSDQAKYSEKIIESMKSWS